MAGDGAQGHTATRGVGTPAARSAAHVSSSTSMGRMSVASTSSDPRAVLDVGSYVLLSYVGQFVASSTTYVMPAATSAVACARAMPVAFAQSAAGAGSGSVGRRVYKQ